MENNISSVQTDPKKSAHPDACVTSIIKNKEQETNVVDIFLEKAKTKSKSILSCRLAQEIFKIAKIPPKVQTSLDLDADDLRWTETLYNNPRPTLLISTPLRIQKLLQSSSWRGNSLLLLN